MQWTSMLGRYWHTLRWLRPVQFYGRAWFRFHRPRPDTRPAPRLRHVERPAWQGCARAASMTGPDSFRLLGIERCLRSPAGWNRPDWPKLWLYNAHYFDDLVADAAPARQDWHTALLRRWIAENAPGQGNGWEPYPSSLRIVNWVKWLWSGHAGDGVLLASLAIQARWLSGRMEHHLLGNHLWANAKALVFAGACFEGDESDAWLQHGLRLLRRELDEQVLEDGGHFERSPMYHAILTEDLLDLLQLADRTGVIPEVDRTSWLQAVRRMLAWATTMAHPDGRPGFFNDTTFAIAPDLHALDAYATALGVESAAIPASPCLLQASGFARLARDGAVVLADVGGVGPSYLPGHAHAGTLSFELSVHGQRQLVNSGISTYQNDLERLRQRSTSAHNTVVVDGEDSSEVWSAFRVARRARVHDVSCSVEGGVQRLRASHDGYRRLPGNVIHRREWCLDATGLRITDTLEGRYKLAEARFHFGPDSMLEYEVEGGEARIESASWHPGFGESVPIRVLSVRFLQPRCNVHFRWG